MLSFGLHPMTVSFCGPATRFAAKARNAQNAFSMATHSTPEVASRTTLHGSLNRFSRRSPDCCVDQHHTTLGWILRTTAAVKKIGIVQAEHAPLSWRSGSIRAPGSWWERLDGRCRVCICPRTKRWGGPARQPLRRETSTESCGSPVGYAANGIPVRPASHMGCRENSNHGQRMATSRMPRSA